jgi:hypothetical protein
MNHLLMIGVRGNGIATRPGSFLAFLYYISMIIRWMLPAATKRDQFAAELEQSVIRFHLENEYRMKKLYARQVSIRSDGSRDTQVKCDNSRLQTLGNQVINFVISSHLYFTFSSGVSDAPLTNHRMSITSQAVIARFADTMHLGSLLTHSLTDSLSQLFHRCSSSVPYAMQFFYYNNGWV